MHLFALALLLSLSSASGTADDPRGPVCAWSFDGTPEDTARRSPDVLSPRDGRLRFVGADEVRGSPR